MVELSTLLAVFILFLGIVISLVICYTIYYFATARPSQLPESYPFQFSTNLLRRKDNYMLHYVFDAFTKANKKTGLSTFSAPVPFSPTMVFINDPANVEYILKTAFNKYEKGPLFYARMTEFLGEGIFNSDGDIWYHHRKTSVKLFNLNIFRGMVMYQFNKHLDIVIDQLRSKNGKSFDFQDLMYRFTLDSIGQIAFGHDVGSLKNTSVAFASDFDYIQQCSSDSFVDPLWYIKRYLTPIGSKFFASIKRLDAMAFKIIQERRQMEESKPIESKPLDDTSTEFQSYDLVSLYLTRQEEGTSITDKQLRDIILNFLIAGRDTTAQALSWSMYRFCIHPATQSKARDEVLDMQRKMKASDSLDRNGWFTYEAIQSLKYLEAFCMEVIRLHPSVPKEVKFAKEDDVLPDKTKVYKGDGIYFCPWIMARTESIWPNCNEFKPERFLNTAKPSPYHFTSFNAGPRTCLGQNLALLEMKCCLARLLVNFEFTLEEDPNKVTYQNSLTHPILGGLKVSAKTRM